jgi:hypothetical protein
MNPIEFHQTYGTNEELLSATLDRLSHYAILEAEEESWKRSPGEN